ncbi:hypothetical protein HRbin04_01074 [archaeon HR04]|nr:hypothetical protein HRbin04_01074 [archaeon HR04]
MQHMEILTNIICWLSPTIPMGIEEIDAKELEILNSIFLEAAKNPEFRKELLSNPAKALAKYDIPDRLKEIVVNTIQGKEQL